MLMYWHAELTMSIDILTGTGRWLKTRGYTLRGYATRHDGYNDQLAYDAVVQINMDPDEHQAFAHGGKSEPDRRLATASWRDLGRFLRDQFGVTHINSKRYKPGRVREDTVFKTEGL